jgi:hypothetical protein
LYFCLFLLRQWREVTENSSFAPRVFDNGEPETLPQVQSLSREFRSLGGFRGLARL